MLIPRLVANLCLSLLLTQSVAAQLLPTGPMTLAEREQLWRDYGQDLADTLAPSKDPRDQMASAALYAWWVEQQPAPPPAPSESQDPRPRENSAHAALANQRNALVRQAVRGAPKDALIQWMSVVDCPATAPEACEVPQAIERLRALEPENAAVWMLDDPAAPALSDEDLARRLDRIVQATRLTRHAGDRLRLFLDAAKRQPVPAGLLAPWASLPPQTAERIRDRFGVGPRYTADTGSSGWLTKHCLDTQGQPRPQHWPACIAAGVTQLELGDTLAMRLEAATLLNRLMPPGEEREAVGKQVLALQWWLHSIQTLSAQSATATVEMVQERGTLMRAPEATEISALHKQLRAHGIALTPPEDWRPAE
jgi:hypothetical protein